MASSYGSCRLRQIPLQGFQRFSLEVPFKSGQDMGWAMASRSKMLGSR